MIMQWALYAMLAIAATGVVQARPYQGGSGLDMTKMQRLINEARNQEQLSSLNVDSQLTKDANEHSQYQSSIGTMTHDNKRGHTQERLEAAGVALSACGENVAFNQRDEEEVMDTWLHSPGHRANILNPDFTHFGAAHIDGYWTQVFATLGHGNAKPEPKQGLWDAPHRVGSMLTDTLSSYGLHYRRDAPSAADPSDTHCQSEVGPFTGPVEDDDWYCCEYE
ncbi:hypothetical protein H4R34_000299 [Dimargaris verticillata]|uniref:SCP domain-containing protein n=1 Tax=Dimargaris verticillata TaxID=2761393 RepID=A0A9W8BC20_9FUNG|nr:hypothetical protein H4R34_000299 [Dimargaris verticillata]